jgi:amino acid transporter
VNAAPPEPRRTASISRHNGKQKGIGALELAFFVVAAAGPLLVVAGYTPLSFSIGGIGAPGAQLVASLVLLFFAVGLTRMALRIPNAGAFYAYIGQAFGKLAGGGAAVLAMLAYSTIAIGEIAVVGAFAATPLSRVTGVQIPWWAWSLIALVIVAFLGHRQISVSAKVLGVALMTEAGVLLLLGICVLFTGGPQAIDLSSFTPSAIFAGGGTGAMFAIVFGAFIGFESTAIYAEEARDPEKTVPRAIYLAVGFLGIFYTFMAWIIFTAYGKSHIVDAATQDPVGLVFTAIDHYVGHPAMVVTEVLLVTSAFASALAFHNTAIRYLHALGRERLLPQTTAKVHPAHRSPYRANIVQTVFTLLVIGAFIVAGAKDAYLGVFLPVVSGGVLAIIVLQTACSASILVYFNVRHKDHGLSRWSTLVAPLLSFVGLLVASYLVATNFALLSGQTGWINIVLLLSLPALVLVGVVRTYWLRIHDPEQYARLTQTNVYQVEETAKLPTTSQN